MRSFLSRTWKARKLAFSCLLLLASIAPLRAEEGMWTFDQLPLKPLQATYGFSPNQAWLDHLRLSTVMFGEDGTGCFVGRDGLVLTNHHIAHAYLLQLSSSGHDLVKDGFVARHRDQEIPIPDLKLQVLMSTRNVSAEAERAVQPGMSSLAAESARTEVLEKLRNQEMAESGLSCELVDLQAGREHWIYRYQVFSDVRLVMAPEYGVAAFGKEWDNFAYPRYDLDFSLFRVYQDGLPYRPPHALDWSQQGIANGDLTLVAGHPGRTNRQETFAQLEFRRQVVNPLIVRTLERRIRTLTAYASQGEENARLVSADLLEASNFLKVYREEIRGLEDVEAMNKIQAHEKAFRSRVAQDPHWQTMVGGSWTALARTFRQQAALAKEYQLMHRNYCSLERGPLYRALQVVRIGTESAKPDSQRLAGYSETEIAALKSELLQKEPLNRELETLLLTAGLEETREWLGGNHPLAKALLAGQDPATVAARAIAGTQIDNQAFVQELLEGGQAALASCHDPLILLAQKLGLRSREVKRQYEALEALVNEHNARLAAAKFALSGANAYPEANFTLRFGFGTVRTYEAEGTLQPPFTTFGGLFDRADAWGPKAEEGSWALPSRWLDRRKEIQLSTPLNFITTNDITGGSSGSPVVNRQGELVGLVFDGNIQSIPGRFYYDGTANRCIALDARAILETLERVYDAEPLVKELTGK